MLAACRRFHFPFIIVPWRLNSHFSSTIPQHSFINFVTFHTRILRMKYIILCLLHIIKTTIQKKADIGALKVHDVSHYYEKFNQRRAQNAPGVVFVV